MNTRPQKFLRATYSTKRTPKEFLKMPQIFRSTICDTSLKVCPDEFIRIKFWCIAREKVSVNSLMFVQKPLNNSRFMYPASIPQKYDWFIDVSQEIFEEIDNLCRTNVFVCVEFDIESQPFPFGGNTDSGNGRYFTPISCNLQVWSLSPGCPCFCDTRNQQESTFIEENQVCSEPSSVFLYMATDGEPTAEWPFCFSLLHAFPVFDNSIQVKPSVSRDCQCNSEFQTFSLSIFRFASESTGLSDTLLPEALSPVISATSFSAIPKATMGGPVPVWVEALFSLSSGKPDASVLQNSVKTQHLPPLHDRCPQKGAFLSLRGDVFLNTEVFHEVS